MQDVERPGQVQALPQPGRARRPRVETEPLRLVVGAEGLDRIGGQRGRGRDLGQGPAVRPPEPEGPVGLARDGVALLVDRAVVPATLCRLPDYAAWGTDTRAGRGGALA